MGVEVVTTLDIDDVPAGAAIKRVKDGFIVLEGGASKAARTLEHEWDRAGPAFVHHMFSMRAAAAAFLGGFSLAGIITGLADLTKTLVENSATWKMASEAAHDFFDTFVLGQDALTQTEEKLKAIGIVTQTMRVDEASHKLAEAFSIQRKAIADLEHELHPEKWSLWETAMRSNEQSGIKVAQAQDAVAVATEGVTEAQIGVQKAMGFYENLPPKIHTVKAALSDLETIWKANVALMDEMDNLLAGGEQHAGPRFKAPIEEQNEWTASIGRTTIAMQVMAQVQQDAANLVANAMAGNVSSLRAFVRAALIEIARMLLVEGFGNMAKGFAALSSGFGSAAAAGYFHAARLDFYGAALAGFGARAVGGESSGGSGRSPGIGGASFQNQQDQRPSPNITVIVEGNATHETVGEIIDAITQGLRDGMGGGNFGGQLQRAV